jgi:type I restriction enzyme S subunit
VNDTNANGALPEGWRHLRVGDVLKLRNGRAFKSGEWMTAGRPIIRIQNLKSEDASFNYFDGELPEQFAARSGDLLFAWSGTPGTSFGAHIWHGPEAWVNQHIFRVDFSASDFDRDFLKFALDANLESYIDQAQGGVGLAHITKSKLNDSVLLAPPVHEQRRIADRLRQVDVRRAAAATHLKTARAVFKRFRSAVIAAACAGRLTDDWRQANPDVNADALLSRLLETGPPKRGGRARATQEHGLTSEAQVELLPSTWGLVRLGDVLGVATGATPLRKNRAYYEGGTIPWVTSGGVNAGTIIRPTELITPLALAETNVRLFPAGTLLIAMYGEGQTRGRVAELAIEAGTNQALAAVLFSGVTMPLQPFVRLFFEDSYRRVRALSIGGVQPNLNLGMIKDTLLPLPPLEEQAEVLRRADAMMRATDGLIAQVDRTAGALDRVTKASLAKAFRGELVAIEAD